MPSEIRPGKEGEKAPGVVREQGRPQPHCSPASRTSPTRRRWWSPWSRTPPTRAAGREREKQWAGRRPRVGSAGGGRDGAGRDRRKEKTLTSLSAAILRCGPPHAQGPAGRRAGRGGCLTQRLIPAQRFVRGCGRTFSHLRGLFRREGVPTLRCKARIVLETLWVRQGPPGSKQNSWLAGTGCPHEAQRPARPNAA